MENLILPTVISTAISSIPSNYHLQQTANFAGLQHSVRIPNSNQWQSFVVTAQPTNVFLQWSIADNQSADQFLIQHSQDGFNWNTIENRNISATLKYSFVHARVEAGTNYYRLLISHDNGNLSYSSVEQVNFTGDN